MARLGLTLAGGLIGGLAGPLGAEIGMVVGGMLGGLLFHDKLPAGPRLSDLHVSSATDGAPIIFGYNQNRVPGNLLFTSGIKEQQIPNTGKSSGSSIKGGSPAQYIYTADIACAFGEGPASITKIWFDSKLVFNSTQAYCAIVLISGIGGGTCTVVTRGSLPVQPGDQVIITGTVIQNPPAGTLTIDQVTNVTSVLGPNEFQITDKTGGAGGSLIFLFVNNGTVGKVVSGAQQQITKLSMVGDLVTAVCNLNPEVGSQILVIDTPAALHANAYAGYFTVIQSAPTFFTYYNPSSPNLFTVGDNSGTIFCGWAVPALPQYAPPTIYPGDELQIADTLVQAAEGAANTPAFRGLCYAVWPNFPLANFGNRVPNIRAEITYLKSSLQQVGAGSFLNNNFVRGQATLAQPNVIFNYVPTAKNSFVVLGLSMNQTGLSSKWVKSYLPGGANGTSAIAIASLPNAVGITENCGVLGNGFPWTANILGFNGSGDALIKPISTVQILNNVVILTLGAPCLYAVGQNVTVAGLTVATFLNNAQLILTSVSADGFTIQAAFVHANYGPAVDSGGTLTNVGYLQIASSGSAFTGNGTYTISLPGSTQKGSLLILALLGTGDINASGYFHATFPLTPPSISDTQGNAWSLNGLGDSNYNDSNTGDTCSMAYAYTSAASSLSVTFKGTGNAAPGAIAIALLEFPADPPATSLFTLPDMVADLSKRSGLTVTNDATSQIDVSSLVIPGTNTPQPGPQGYAITRPTTAQEALKPLAAGYFFDAVESTGVLRFVQRGAAIASLTIPESDLGLEKDNAKIEESISMLQDLPREVQVLFNDPSLGFQQNHTHKRRSTRIVHTKNQSIIEFPFTIDASTARQIAEKTLFTDHLERKPYKFSTWKAVYSLLDPTDIVQFTYENLTFQARIVKTVIGVDFKVEFTTVNELQSTYTSTVVGSSASGANPNPVTKTLPNTTLFLLDIPLLQDLDSNPIGTGFYAAFSSLSIDWTGASLEQSADDVNFTQIDTDSVVCAYGTTLSTLPAPQHSPFSWDTVSTLNIRMIQGALTGNTDLNVLNGANVLIVGSSANGWEIIQFANATQNADGSFTISRLIRGRRGTEVLSGTHTSNDTVIAVNPGGINHELQPLGNLYLSLFYLGLTFGGVIQNPPGAVTFINTGNDLRPWAVNDVRGSRDGSNNLTVTWQRRTRIGGDWLENVGVVPLSETTESYDVDVLGGSGSAVVKRTFAALSSPTVSYTAAQQIADFGRTLPYVTLNIYQNSSVVGRGFQKTVTV